MPPMNRMELPMKSSSGTVGNLRFDLESSKVYGGHKVKGAVCVDVNMPAMDCTLTLSFVCQEWCYIEGIQPPPGSQNRPEPSGEATVDIAPPVYQTLVNHQALQPGTKLNFEFSFAIPDNAPAAFEIDNGRAKGYIRYLLMAKLTSAMNPELITWKKIKVREHFSQVDQMHREAEGTVEGYCYSSKGKLRLSYDMQSMSSLTTISDVFQGNLGVDNRGCPFEIKQFYANLGYTIYMNAQSRHTVQGGTIMSWNLPGVPGSQMKSVEVKQQIPYNPDYKLMCSSSKGKLLRRTYAFNLSPSYDTFTCSVPNICVNFDLEHIKAYKKKK